MTCSCLYCAHGFYKCWFKLQTNPTNTHSSSFLHTEAEMTAWHKQGINPAFLASCLNTFSFSLID